MASSYSTFPDYTDAERWADAVVHIVGLIAAPLAVVWLFAPAVSVAFCWPVIFWLSATCWASADASIAWETGCTSSDCWSSALVPITAEVPPASAR